MLRNYLIIAWRNLWKHPTLSLINICGLAIGIATCFVIMLYVADELSYDRYHEKADQIFRVVLRGKLNGELIKEANTPTPVAQTLQQDYPEVLQSTRIRNFGTPQITYKRNTFRDSKLAFVDANFLQVFTLPLIKGDPATVLKEPRTIVITKEQALKYFGDENPIGKILDFKEWNQGYKVTGVIDKVPANSHFHFDVFASMEGLAEAKELNWVQSNYHSYLVLNKDYNYRDLELKLPQFVEKYMGPQLQEALGMSYTEFHEKGNEVGLFLQPLTDIHLHSDFTTVSELEPGGDIKSVYIFCVVALFILLIACINFINLTTAAATKRAKEVGVKKVLGSKRTQLISQFLTESFMVTIAAMLIALVLVALALPLFNGLSGKALVLGHFLTPQIVILLAAFAILVSILAGSYPAFILSNYKPVIALKSNFKNSANGKSVRSGLVVFQFVISAGLILATLIVDRQMSFIQNKDIGYTKDQLLVLRDSGLLGNSESAFKELLRQDSRIERITNSGYIPVGPTNINMRGIYPDQQSDAIRRTFIYEVDDQYIPTMGMELASGRNFSKTYGSDSSSTIINETAARIFGFANDALDKTLIVSTNNQGGRMEFKVIGVVKDFHFKTLHQSIEPLVMINYPSPGLIIKANTSEMAGLIASIEKMWKGFNVEEPFNYSLLDESFNQSYLSERNLGTIIRIFALLTIFVACLGLFGLVTFTVEQKFKEIGIRKVLGSSVSQIVSMLSKDFLKLVFISLLLAFPLSYYLMNKWLQDFAYRIEIHWWVFVAAGVVTLIIAFLTIGIKSLKAGMANPVDSLRNE